MGSMCSCSGSRLSNSVFPTNMTLPYKLRNSDLALYRRYRKKDDVDNGKVSRKAKSKHISDFKYVFFMPPLLLIQYSYVYIVMDYAQWCYLLDKKLNTSSF